MVILGVDPGTLVTGFAVIESTRSGFDVLACDVVKNTSEKKMPVRLKNIYDALTAVIEQWHPDEFAIETAFYGKNAQSALKIGHARGVSILAAVNREIPTAEYSPREVKRAVVGNGGASKHQVQFMVKQILKLKTVPKYYDATDALAVALCHAQRVGRVSAAPSRRRSSSWSVFVREHPKRVVRA
jgi:crossover junction endodeoxyribonuclease RuvC